MVSSWPFLLAILIMFFGNEFLRKRYYSVIETKEPRGRARDILLNPDHPLTPKEELAIFIDGRAEHFSEIIKKSSLTIWNGPMGISEVEKFSQGTKVIAEAVVKAKHSIVGGGDTIAAVDKLGLLDKFSYVSTGGGAMLAFLADEELPGLKALGYYKK